jgi:hypothetical protein
MAEQKHPTVSFEGYTFAKVGSEYYSVCGRCGGTGEVWAKHVFNGVCFQCGGFGAVGKPVTDPEKTAKTRAKAKAKRDEKKEAERQEKLAKYLAEEAVRQDEEAAREAARAAERGKFEWLGEEGQPVEFSGEVVFLKEVESNFGYRTTYSRMVVVKVSETVEVKFFSTAQWVWALEQGEQVTVKATVKEHGEYDGKKTTQVARPKRVAHVEKAFV